MNHETRMLFQETPGVFSQYRRALFARGNDQKSGTFPNIEAWQSAVHVDANDVKNYSTVCGFPVDGKHLPLTYPHILSFPLHMELMLHKEFPLALMGLVHIRNTITQYRAITFTEALNIRCTFGDMRKTDKGLEFDICTEISHDNDIIWKSVSTNLSRKGATKGSKNRVARPLSTNYEQVETWYLASNLGRRYARVSGDSNPIHLFSFTARLFGFPRHIIHGMWSNARTAAALQPTINSDCCTMNAEFKLPVFLPSSVTLHWTHNISQSTSDFELRDKSGEKTHMKGSITAL